ncbi:7503_t:CDS:2, partial [Funneliformis geosporum]
EMACALRLFEVKSRCNLTDDAFRQTILAVNNEPIWIDMCINSCCTYTGRYKKHIQCEYCGTPRYKNATSNELRYCANYTCHQGFGLNGNIGNIFDGTRYQELLSSNLFQDERD